jgi:hypothetical protein
MYEKQFFGVFVGGVLLILCIVASISYIGDPGGVFQSDNGKYENKMVDILLSGHNVTFKENIDWGRFQSAFIARDPAIRDTIVLGSSRVMVINNAMLDSLPIPKDRNFLNSWVADAKLGDEIAVVMNYAQKSEIPKTIIIGLDPPSFDREGLVFPSQDLQYNRGLEKIGYSPGIWDGLAFMDNKCFELISYSNLIAAIQKIRSGEIGVNLTQTDDLMGEDWVNSWDGTRAFPQIRRERTTEEVEKEARAFIAANGTWKMKPKQVAIFEGFTGYLLQHHVSVILFLPPWHPIIYEKFKKDPGYSMVLESENYIRKYAEDKHITVIGSYDPGRYNFTSADFYDATHLKPDAVARIFADGDIGGQL